MYKEAWQQKRAFDWGNAAWWWFSPGTHLMYNGAKYGANKVRDWVSNAVTNTQQRSAETARQQAETGASNIAKTIEDTSGRISDKVNGDVDTTIRRLGNDFAVNAAKYGLSQVGGQAALGLGADAFVRWYNRGRREEDKLPKGLIVLLAALGGQAGGALTYNRLSR